MLAERARDAAADGDAATADAIAGAIVERTGVRPHTVRVLAPGTLPRTSSGKLRRSEALRQFLANELAPPRPFALTRLPLAALRSVLAFARVRHGDGE